MVMNAIHRILCIEEKLSKTPTVRATKKVLALAMMCVASNSGVIKAPALPRGEKDHSKPMTIETKIGDLKKS